MNTSFFKRIFLSVAVLCASLGIKATAAYTQLTDIPTVYIITENNQPITNKVDYVKATLVWVDQNGEKTYANNLGIRGRGNSTWNLAKKPYRIKFDKKTEFLGPTRAKAKSWTLMANFADKTLIRNAVAATIGDFAGQPFTAAATFVDLVLNGTYLGNYQISDQIEIREKRIDITEQDLPATPESNITGGYFLEVDGFGEPEPEHFYTPRGVLITLKSPDSEIINQDQRNYIQNHIAAFENALFSDNFTDPEKGYRKYVDASTLASWYIGTELTGNVDGFWSTNIYKEKDDDKIYWGPMWDYDVAFNNCNRVGDVSCQLMADAGFGANLTRLWIQRMWQDPWFVHLINDTWKELVARGIEQHVLDFIDAKAAYLERSQTRNYRRWSISQRYYNELVLFNTYAEGIDYLKSFVSEHTEFLTLAFQDRADLVPAPFKHDSRFFYTIANKGCGKFAAPATDGSGMVIYTPNAADNNQEWVVKQVDTCYMFINRATNLAATDLSSMSGSRYVAGKQIAFQSPDSTNTAQLWRLAPIAGANTFCIVNQKTGFLWNNSSGSAVDGNKIISWVSDNQNSGKTTRQWVVTKSSPVPDGGLGFNDLKASASEYHLSYVPSEQILCFVSHDDTELTGTVQIYNTLGTLLLEAPVAPSIDIANLPTGTLIVNWQIPNEKPRTVKFQH